MNLLILGLVVSLIFNLLLGCEAFECEHQVKTANKRADYWEKAFHDVAQAKLRPGVVLPFRALSEPSSRYPGPKFDMAAKPDCYGHDWVELREIGKRPERTCTRCGRREPLECYHPFDRAAPFERENTPNEED